MKLRHEPIRQPRKGYRGEVVFAQVWAELMAREILEGSFGCAPPRPMLEQILSNYCDPIGQREASVAASLVCWLGTNIGSALLANCRRYEATRDPLGDWADSGSGYLAAWAVHNQRRTAFNGGWRALELMLEPEGGGRSLCSANDLEVAELVMCWLGTSAGQDMLALAERRIDRYKKLDQLAFFRSHGQGDTPIVADLEAELAMVGEVL